MSIDSAFNNKVVTATIPQPGCIGACATVTAFGMCS